MSGSSRSSAGLDERRKRILFRSWHRGLREMDLILGRFMDHAIGDLSDEELEEVERLLDVPDRDVYGWLTGEEDTPEFYDGRVFRQLKRFHSLLKTD